MKLNVADFGSFPFEKLLAMALGSIAKPLETRLEPLDSASRSVSGDDEKSRQQAELYYQYALRRIGMIGGSLTACQCHFLNGIYLLYTLRPVQAWQAFFHASSLYTVYLKSRAAAQQIGPGHYHDDVLIGDESCSGEKLRCCLEQRLYWSCIKSERLVENTRHYRAPAASMFADDEQRNMHRGRLAQIRVGQDGVSVPISVAANAQECRWLTRHPRHGCSRHVGPNCLVIRRRRGGKTRLQNAPRALVVFLPLKHCAAPHL